MSAVNNEAGTCTVDVLERQDDGAWVVGDVELVAPQEAIYGRVNFDYSQRQANRATNPHGEHAEEVFELLEGVPHWALNGRSEVEARSS